MSEHPFGQITDSARQHEADAHEATSGTAYSHITNYANIYTHTNAAYRSVAGFRFLVNAPAGVTINAAYLQLTQVSGGSVGAVPRGDIKVEPIPNPDPWATSDGATTSTQSPFDRWDDAGRGMDAVTPVSWNYGSAGTNNVTYNTADFASLVQTVVDHGSYDPADDAYRIVAVYVKGHNATALNWRCHTVESATSGYRPVLVLDYTAPVPAPSVAVTVSLPQSFFPAVGATLPVTVTIPTPDINPITPQYLTGTAIASVEAHGTGVVGVGAVNLTGTAIASVEAHGTGAVAVGVLNIGGTAVTPAETHGTGTINPGAVNLTGTAIGTAEVFGTGEVTLASSAQDVGGQAIASVEAHGTGDVGIGVIDLTGTAVASVEAHGTGTVTLGTTIVGTAIDTVEAHGTGAVTIGAAVLVGQAIVSTEAHGTGTVNPGPVNLGGTGLASAEAHGLGQVVLGVLIVGAGITSAETHGTGVVAVGTAPARRIRRSARRPDMSQSAREEGDNN